VNTPAPSNGPSSSVAPAARADGWLNACMRGLEVVIALLLMAMVVMVFGNVVLRYVFNSGITVSEELSRWAFVWLTFLGAIVALKEHGHLGSDLLVSRLPAWGKRLCLGLSLLLMLGVTWLLLEGSWKQVLINRDVEAPVTGWSMAIIYLAGIAFAVPAAGLLLRDLWRLLRGRMRDDELVQTQESEELAHVQAVPSQPTQGKQP
jgi:TRAP-type transport system small permease protein